jgi:hypothetical protein
MKLTIEDLAALVLVQITALLITGAIIYAAMRFCSVDIDTLFKQQKN